MTDQQVTTWGKRMRARREELGLTQEQLAARVPCRQGTMSNYELDRVLPSQRRQLALAKALDAKPATLFPFRDIERAEVA